MSSKGTNIRSAAKGNPKIMPASNFFIRLKKEMIYCKEYYSFEEARSDISEYIESRYNRKRRHTFLNYKTPHKV